MAIRLHILLFALVAALSGCSAADDAGVFPQSNASGEPPVVRGENLLFQHDVAGANAVYTQELQNDPTNGSVAVGKATTDLLLLPYSPEVTALLTDGLGARRGLSTDDNTLYRPEGLLDLLSRGVALQDDGPFSGIETLLEGELPWERGRFESAQTFVAGLDSPVNDVMDHLVGIADAMDPIYDNLDIALQDASFGAFYLPGTVFFDDELSLELGKSEVAFLRGAVGGVQSAIYFTAAYDNTWTLDEAFGARWDEVAAEPTDPEYVEGWLYDDYVNSFLSDEVARTIRDASLLSRSREAARKGLLNLRAGLEYGIDRVETNEPDRTLTFSDASLDDARDVVDLVQAVENALYGETAIPFTEPDTTMDLSSFFEDGRTLPTEEEWLERVVIVDEFGETFSWEVTDAAFDTFFVQGVFNPAFDADNPPDVEIGSPNAEESFVDTIAGDLTRTVESTYGTR